MTSAKQTQVVITGVGPVSPIGIGKEEFLAAFQADESTLAGNPPRAEIRDFDLGHYLESQKTYLDRCSEFTLAACSLALKDADLQIAGEARWRSGICLGTAYGCVGTLQTFTSLLHEKGARLANPLLFSHAYINTPVSLAAIEFDLAGFHSNVCHGSISGSLAIAVAADAIRAGRAEVMLAGGTEAFSQPLLAAQQDSRPLGEGAGMVVLESADHAQARGAQAYAEVAAWASAGGHDSVVRASDLVHVGTGHADVIKVSISHLLGDTLGVGESLSVITAALTMADQPVQIDAFDASSGALSILLQSVSRGEA